MAGGKYEADRRLRMRSLSCVFLSSMLHLLLLLLRESESFVSRPHPFLKDSVGRSDTLWRARQHDQKPWEHYPRCLPSFLLGHHHREVRKRKDDNPRRLLHASKADPIVGADDATSASDAVRSSTKATIGTAIILIPSTSDDDDEDEDENTNKKNNNNNRDVPKRRSRYGSKSPVAHPNFRDAAFHLANKVEWFSEGSVSVKVIPVVPTKQSARGNEEDEDEGIEHHDVDLEEEKALLEVDALIALGLSSSTDLKRAKDIFDRRGGSSDAKLKRRQCQIALDCSNPHHDDRPSSSETSGPSSDHLLSATVSSFDSASPSISSAVLPWTDDASAARLYRQMTDLFDRWTSDDFAVAVLLFFDRFCGSGGQGEGEGGRSVDWVKHSIDATWEKGPWRNAKEFYSMISQCGDCIGRCVKDDACRECLDALTEIDTRDQVASYRTIVSYESDLLRDFSYCILQKNNIFGCDAEIPKVPVVPPLTSWRGRELTTEAARSILIGHLDDESAPEGGLKTDISWKVAAGANVAYDQFPSQNQIFYEAINGRDMWYDPVFRVETIDGRNVWCKRHYKVRNGPTVGTFRFSVLDNGITSSEFWTVVDVADDLSWIVFHYAGAASAVGQKYLGGLLCTADGSLPTAATEDMERIWKAMKSAGIEPWDLFVVDNDPASPGLIAAGPPPLDYFRKDVLLAKKERAQQEKS